MLHRSILLLASILSLAITATLPAQRQAKELFFDLTDPQEAAKWKITSHDEAQGPGGWQDGQFAVASDADAPVFIERAVQFDASEYNRLIVDLYAEGDGGGSGYAGTAFFFSHTDMVIPESRLLRNLPMNVRTQLVFRLDQSVFWDGPIRMIRLDPIWGVGRARVVSLKFDREPPPSPAPSWNFMKSDGHLGWTIGEFGIDNPSFYARHVNQTIDGISFTAEGPNPVLQHFDIMLNADFIKSFEVILKNETGVPSTSRFFWADPENRQVTEANSIHLPVAASDEFQRLTYDLHNHPGWRGQIGFLLYNPVLTPGKVTIRGMRFNAVEGLGERGEEDALVVWRTHQEVGSDLKSGNYKPLLVLVTKNGNEFSQKIEYELAGNREFLSLADDFHAVRLQFDDPATSRVFQDLYRIPVLATMKYDFDAGQWQITARLNGPEVSSGCLDIMKTASSSM